MLRRYQEADGLSLGKWVAVGLVDVEMQEPLVGLRWRVRVLENEEHVAIRVKDEVGSAACFMRTFRHWRCVEGVEYVLVCVVWFKA